MKRSSLLLLAMIASVFAFPTERDKNPVELGKVRWERNYAEAQKLAKQTDRDIFLLFQEVPG